MVQCEVIYFRILHNILVYTHVAWLLTTGCTVARGGVFQPWNTPSLAERFLVSKIEMQGTKFSNIKCSIQIDTLGKECYTSGEGLFLYKKAVFVPPLGMIDDIVSFALSGPDAIKTNAIINAKIKFKKKSNLEQQSVIISISEKKKRQIQD